jgi:3-dehydroquinate synthase
MTTSPPVAVLDYVVPGPPPRVISVDLPETNSSRSYDIVVGANILSDAGTLIAERLGKRSCLIITDDTVGELYQKRLEAVLAASGHTLLPTVSVPAGEGSKNFTTLQSVLERVLGSNIDRKTLIVALGGGVVGDLAGVTASLALRGLDFVQIPTTLLSQVDSSVGGKTGINSNAGKNTVGAFYQPRLVISDVTLLDSLPRREMLAGYAEVVKYGLIDDPAFFGWCKAYGAQLLAGDHKAQVSAVAASCTSKAKIVAADERESGARALLNLGHTFGHALEAVLGYNSGHILHGESVAVGTVMAFRLSAQLGLCPHAEAYEVRDHFVSVGLPVKPPVFDYNIDQLMEFMFRDKKAQAGRLRLILVRGIGKAFIADDVSDDDVRDTWRGVLPAR